MAAHWRSYRRVAGGSDNTCQLTDEPLSVGEKPTISRTFRRAAPSASWACVTAQQRPRNGDILQPIRPWCHADEHHRKSVNDEPDGVPAELRRLDGERIDAAVVIGASAQPRSTACASSIKQDIADMEEEFRRIRRALTASAERAYERGFGFARRLTVANRRVLRTALDGPVLEVMAVISTTGVGRQVPQSMRVSRCCSWAARPCVEAWRGSAQPRAGRLGLLGTAGDAGAQAGSLGRRATRRAVGGVLAWESPWLSVAPRRAQPAQAACQAGKPAYTAMRLPALPLQRRVALAHRNARSRTKGIDEWSSAPRVKCAHEGRFSSAAALAIL